LIVFNNEFLLKATDGNVKSQTSHLTIMSPINRVTIIWTNRMQRWQKSDHYMPQNNWHDKRRLM